jgi:uncharacterized protein (TIGR02594 family)
MFAPLPPAYAWLYSEPGPYSLLAMLAIHGLREAPGEANNPFILAMGDFLGLKETYLKDSTAWCGLGKGWATKMSGFEPVKDPLWALNWAKWGNPADVPMLGDTVVFKRIVDGEAFGHVGDLLGEDATHFHVLGCNQSDMCCIRRFPKEPWREGMDFGLVAVRRAKWRIAQPQNIRPVVLSADGAPSSTKVS